MANRSYSTKTIKALFGLCGNQCAYPGCTNSIILSSTEFSDQAVVGQICHIYAASDDGPRGNAALTDEQRNAPENLILLCGHHHPSVDTQWRDYPADLLKQWKKQHEAKFQPGTAEAIQRQEQAQRFAFTVELTDQQIEAEVGRIRQARNLVGYPVVDKALALAANVERIELASGSRAVRARALAWCARVLARGENLSRAKELIARSRELGGSPETELAHAFAVAAEADGSGPALSLLAPLDTPAARSVMLRIVSNERGPDAATTWARSAGLELSSFDTDGKLNLIMNEEVSGRWDEAFSHAEQLTDADFQATPLLMYAAATAFLAHVVPDSLRTAAIFQLPFDAAGTPLSDDEQALKIRRRASDLFERQSSFASAFGAKEAAGLSSDMALWLRLRDQETSQSAMEDLRDSMRDEAQSLRRFPLALQFGLKLDLDAIERRINERVALSGKGTPDEAVARLAMAMTKPTPKDAVEYIASHRDQLYEFLERPSLLSMEIELLCQAGQIDSANAKLAEAADTDFDQRQRSRLLRVIAEAEGADPAAERRRLYEQTGDLRDLANLVNFLEAQKAWQDLCPLTEALFGKTHAVEDAQRAARALERAGEHKRLLQFLLDNAEIVAREDELRSLLSWTLYRDGQFKAASEALAALRAKRDHINDRALFVNLAIATGQWDSLVGYTTQEWEHKDERTAEDLLRAGQLAQAVGGPHARELIVAATQRAPDDPNVLAPAYFYATNAGWEQDQAVGQWLIQAAEKSGEQGPLKSLSMKELYDLKPDWDRRQQEVYAALSEGKITVTGAAQALNQSVINSCLLVPSANRIEVDPRRRNLVYAFSGARPFSVAVTPSRLAFDLTAIFTLSQLGLLDKVISHHDRVLIADQTLVWLFQERERARFHQPSRVKDAHFLRQLLAEGSLRIFIPQGQTSVALAQEVGFDLAAMLNAAAHARSPAFVIRSSPVHRVGTVMEEVADLGAHETRLCSCHGVVEALRLKGMMTATEEQRALSYLKLHEMRWPEEPRIPDGATLFLDDLTTTYLRTVGVLEKLKPAGFTAYVTKSLDDQDNQLITFENFFEKQHAIIETIRASLAGGLANGRIETIASPERDSEAAQLQAQLNFLATDKEVDAFVVDDRFVNRYLNMERGGTQTPIITSLDLIDQLGRRGLLTEEEVRECRTDLRRAGYSFVPVSEDELVHFLSTAPLIEGRLAETAELKAIREAALKLRMSNTLQVPHELPWLQQYTVALIHAARRLWKLNADPKETEARCEWLIEQLDVRGWAAIAEKGAAVQFSQSSYAGVIHALATAPDITTRKENEAYHRWIDSRLLQEVKETELEIYRQIVSSATAMFHQSVEDAMRRIA